MRRSSRFGDSQVCLSYTEAVQRRFNGRPHSHTIPLADSQLVCLIPTPPAELAIDREEKEGESGSVTGARREGTVWDSGGAEGDIPIQRQRAICPPASNMGALCLSDTLTRADHCFRLLD